MARAAGVGELELAAREIGDIVPEFSSSTVTLILTAFSSCVMIASEASQSVGPLTVLIVKESDFPPFWKIPFDPLVKPAALSTCSASEAL